MKHATRSSLALLGLVSLCPAQLPLSEEILESPQPQPDYSFGQSFALVDVNKDGIDDLIATETNADVMGVFRAGRAWVMYGPDFAESSLLQTHDPVESAGLGGGLVNDVPGPPVVGDVDGDGHLDILIGAPSYDRGDVRDVGRVHLFYGPDFARESILEDNAPVYIGRLGYSVLLADVTGDGLDDVLAGAPEGGVMPATGEALEGRVLIWDARDLRRPRKTLYPRDIGQLSSVAFGDAVRRGDIDGDGRPELLIGAPFIRTEFGGPLGRVFAYRIPGLGFADLLEPPTPPEDPVYFSHEINGFSDVVHVGDLSGDGVPDLFVGAILTSHGPAGDTTSGAVVRVDGPDFDFGEAIVPPDLMGQKDFGQSTVLADFDLDGNLDGLAGDRHSGMSEGQAWICWGPDFEVSQSLNDQRFELPLFGNFVGAGDVDDDGWPEAYVSYPATNGNGKGLIFRFEVETLNLVTSSDSITVEVNFGATRAGQSAGVRLSLAEEAQPVALFEAGVLESELSSWAELPLVTRLDQSGRASLRLPLDPGAAQVLGGQVARVEALTWGDDGLALRSSNVASAVLFR